MKPYIVIDTETTSTDYNKADLVCTGYHIYDSDACYDTSKITFEKDNQLEYALKNPDILKVGHNIKFDIHVLERAGYEVNGDLYDTRVAEYVLNPDKKSLGLKDLGKEYKLAENILEFKELMALYKKPNKKGKMVKINSILEIPKEILSEYCAKDVLMTEKLYLMQQDRLPEEDKKNVFWNIEFPLTRLLYDMEKTGFKVDIDKCRLFASELRAKQEVCKKRIFELAGKEFNLRSGQQLNEVLFVKLGLPAPKKTKSGKSFATDKEALQSLLGLHPIVKEIVDFKECEKIVNTYFEVYPDIVLADGRIHSTFNQASVETGRLSSDRPNLQNVPRKGEMGAKVREVLVSDTGSNLVVADFSNLEMRIISVVARDAEMQKAFHRNDDLHKLTAQAVFNKPISEITEDDRDKAKTINFGINYGSTKWGLSKQLGVSTDDAQIYRLKYLNFYHGVKQFMYNYPKVCKITGHTETLLGRKRHLKDIEEKMKDDKGGLDWHKVNRALINTPIQGTASDITKIAMLRLDKAFKRWGVQAKILLQVHDEIVVECLDLHTPFVKTLMEISMTSVSDCGVPLEVKISHGLNWREAKA